MSNYRELIEALAYQPAADRLSHRAAHALDELQQRVSEQVRIIRSLESDIDGRFAESDHLSAKYWLKMRAAQVERDALAARVKELEAKWETECGNFEHADNLAKGYLAQRDALAAALRNLCERRDKAADRYVGLVDTADLRTLLGAAPDDLLRDHDAEVWDDAVVTAHGRLQALVDDDGLIDQHLLIHAPVNPYREKLGDDR